MFRLSWAMWGQEEERKRGEMGPGAAAMRTKVLKGWVIKMFELYKEEHPRPLGWNIQGRWWVC